MGFGMHVMAIRRWIGFETTVCGANQLDRFGRRALFSCHCFLDNKPTDNMHSVHDDLK
jgi:hypothetical protein